MKIIHVLYSGLGGHGNVFFSLFNADAKKKHNLEALFYGIEDVRSEFCKECDNNNIPRYFAKKNYKIDFLYYYKILKYIRKSEPDIIFLHGGAYIFLAKIASLLTKKRCKIIIRETQANKLKNSGQWVSLIAGMYLANYIVCLTNEFKDQLQKKLKCLYREQKIRIIPNGIDLTVYKPGQKPKANIIVIGMQSRLVRIKDHITLLKAFSILTRNCNYNLRLRIAGEGDFKDQLIDMSNQLQLNEKVEFTGMLDEKELVLFLQSLDIYVHASLGETMSTAIMQAMACKLPIIASDVSGINNMISHLNTGLLVKPLDENMLVIAIKYLIDHPEERELLSKNAYYHSQLNYSNISMFELYNNLY